MRLNKSVINFLLGKLLSAVLWLIVIIIATAKSNGNYNKYISTIFKTASFSFKLCSMRR